MSRTFGQVPSSNRKNLLLILAGLVITVLLVAGILLVIGSTPKADPQRAASVVKQNNDSSVKMIEVLVPSQTIEAGAELDPALFRKEKRPQVGVSARTVKDFEEIKGQFAKSLIIAGQPVHREYLTSSRPISSVSPNIPDGYRAVAISVNSTSAVEGWAQPGSKVDVSWTSSVNGQPSISIIVQNAKILSAQKNTNPNSDPGAPVPTTITLLVSAIDAQKIQLAQTTGSLNLQLRGDPDTGRVNIGENTITTQELLQAGGKDKDEDCDGEVVISGKSYCFTRNKTLKPKAD
jgi:pilus assembly protein CpaB